MENQIVLVIKNIIMQWLLKMFQITLKMQELQTQQHQVNMEHQHIAIYQKHMVQFILEDYKIRNLQQEKVHIFI